MDEWTKPGRKEDRQAGRQDYEYRIRLILMVVKKDAEDDNVHNISIYIHKVKKYM